MSFAIGDLIEFETAEGSVYAQVTHRPPGYPPVVRVIEGQPEDPASGRTAFVALVPIERAMALARQATHLGTRTVPPDEAVFPTFRLPVRRRDGTVLYWWLWDGAGLTHVGELSESQADLPLRDVTGAAEFLARIGAAR